uniref:Guanylate binding protein 1, interferon-inducible n=1 Tax=Sus scrofa TaxID=9823 RepID=A0A8D0VWL3_PIG
MASGVHMPEPQCLIENINGRLVVNPKALKLLSAIKQPLVVVAIVGLYRTGKSYLMNKLAGKNKGFSLGSTVQSHTKGIWMWCVPHPRNPDHTLVLLDTEGLGDVEKGDNQNDSWLFALAVLLSSTLIYNSVGTISQQAMDQLHYVTELTDCIRAKSSSGRHEVKDSADFVSFFPDFVWTLRDFSLELEAKSEPIIADEYLENSLKLRQGNDKKTKSFNETRLCIRKFFPEKKCFIFDRPAQRKYLVHLEQLPEEDVDPEFREQVEEFCSYILSHSKVKTLSGGITVNGPRDKPLPQLASSLFMTLPPRRAGKMDHLRERQILPVCEAFVHRFRTMSGAQPLAHHSILILPWFQHDGSKRCLTIMTTARSIIHEIEAPMKEVAGGRWEIICNMKASSDHCMTLLQDIFGPLYEDVKQGTFSKPGGFRLFIRKRQELKNKYYQAPRKGIQAEETLKKYLDSRVDLDDALLQTDLSLTEEEKETEVERVMSEYAEVANKVLEEMHKKNEEMMEEKKKSYKEQMELMAQKIEEERSQLMAEIKSVLKLKNREQKQLLEEGFLQESMNLLKEIHIIKMRRTELSLKCSIL